MPFQTFSKGLIPSTHPGPSEVMTYVPSLLRVTSREPPVACKALSHLPPPLLLHPLSPLTLRYSLRQLCLLSPTVVLPPLCAGSPQEGASLPALRELGGNPFSHSPMAHPHPHICIFTPVPMCSHLPGPVSCQVGSHREKVTRVPHPFSITLRPITISSVSMPLKEGPEFS